MTKTDHASRPTPIQHPALLLRGIAHGFFTKAGGVSNGVYASLNAGPGSHDAPEKVAENRARIAKTIGVAPTHLLSPYQVHSPDVVSVSMPWPGDRPKADGLVTATRGIALGIMTADCGPILFADAKAKIIGAAHAGWQGAIGGVIDNTIAAMEALGASRGNTIAVLGPTISQRNYEVGADFAAKAITRDALVSGFFMSGISADKRQFDLPGYILARAARAGIQCSNTALCTYADEQRFYSYRRTTHRGEADYGRQLSVICLE
jgi:polyphenol oxidase